MCFVSGHAHFVAPLSLFGPKVVHFLGTAMSDIIWEILKIDVPRLKNTCKSPANCLKVISTMFWASFIAGHAIFLLHTSQIGWVRTAPVKNKKSKKSKFLKISQFEIFEKFLTFWRFSLIFWHLHEYIYFGEQKIIHSRARDLSSSYITNCATTYCCPVHTSVHACDSFDGRSIFWSAGYSLDPLDS